MTATAVDKTTGKFRSRESLSSPVGMGFEFFDANPQDKVMAAGGVATLYKRSVDLIEGRVKAVVKHVKTQCRNR